LGCRDFPEPESIIARQRQRQRAGGLRLPAGLQ
jgi:hypothetical protein